MNTTAIKGSVPEWNGLSTTIRPFLTFFVVAGLIGNSLVLVLFLRLKRLKTWDNAFNINMAVSNLISSVASIALPFTPEFPTARVMSCHYLRVMQLCGTVIYISLIEIAVLRYWRVNRPGRNIRMSIFLMGLVVPWSSAICIVIVSLIHGDTHNALSCVQKALLLVHNSPISRLIFLLIVITIGICVITTCYVKIVIYYRRRCRGHVQIIAAVQVGTSTENNAGRQFVHHMQEFYRSQMNEDKEVVKNSVLLVGAFYVIQMPSLAWLCCYYGGIIRNVFPTFEYILLLKSIGFAINPALYSMRNKYFRQGLKQLFHGRPNSVGTEIPLQVSTYMWAHSNQGLIQYKDVILPV